MIAPNDLVRNSEEAAILRSIVELIYSSDVLQLSVPDPVCGSCNQIAWTVTTRGRLWDANEDRLTIHSFACEAEVFSTGGMRFPEQVTDR